MDAMHAKLTWCLQVTGVDLSNNWFSGRIPDSFQALAHPGIKVSLNGNLMSCCGVLPKNLSVSTDSDTDLVESCT
jgi:hypothetical protein